MIRLLVWLQWRQLLPRGLRDLSSRKIIGVVAILFFGALFMLALTAGAVVLANQAGRDVFESVASYGLLIFSIVILLGELPLVFNALFSSRDLELLFTLPIPTRNIFLVKFGQSLLYDGFVSGLVALIPALAYGIAGDVSWLYYPVVVLVVAGAVAVVIALSYLLSLVVVRIVPARRAKELMTVLTMLAGLLIALGSSLSGGVSIERASHLPSLPTWLPMRWGAAAAVQAARGEVSSLLPLAGLLLLAVGLLALSSLLVERGFRLGWVQQGEGGGGRRRGRKRATRPATARARAQGDGVHRPEVAIGLKDVRLLRRDVREWMSLAPLLVFYGIFIVQLLGKGNGLGAIEGSAGTVWLMTQISLLFALTFLGMNFAAPALAREGPGIWLLRSLPISGWQMALGKFWVYVAVPLALLFLIEIIAGIALGWTFAWIAGGIVVLAILVAGAVALGLWVGTFGAQYNPDRPQQRLNTGAGLALFVINVLYFLLAFVPAALTLLPASLEPDIAAVIGQTSGWLHTVLRAANFVVEQKVAYGSFVTVLGALWLVVFGGGIALLTLWLTARRVDAGVQVRIIEGR